MKSPLVMNSPFVPHKAGYSDLQVMQSAAGYYVGTIYTGEDGFKEPGSRDSDYFSTREEAERFLRAVNTMTDDEAAASLRQCH